MYSWVGDNRFHDRGLFDLVREGAISTGTFSSFLVSLFSGDKASFSYNGDRTIDGRLVVEFGFRVPLEKSNYLFRFGKRTEVLTAYDGTILVDPNTVDLVRLDVRQTLPSETKACEANHTVDYGHVSIGGSDVLLATEARLNILTFNEEMENRIVYSDCHEFVGQSVLLFGPPPELGRSRTKDDSTTRVVALPPGRPFSLAFTESIDTAVAAGGDPIKAKLMTAIRDQSSKILVPEGAVVSGHIIEIRHFYPSRSLVIGVKLDTLDMEGISRPFKARSDFGLRRFTKATGGVSSRVDLGSLDLSQDREVGFFEFQGVGQNFVVKSGRQSKWLTLAP